MMYISLLKYSQQWHLSNIVLLKWFLDIRSEYLLRLKPFRKFANSWQFDRQEDRDSTREKVPANERTVLRKYDNSWPSNQGFSNFLFEHKLFITFQLLNFILNQIESLEVKSRKFTTAVELNKLGNKASFTYLKNIPPSQFWYKYRFQT